MFSVLTALLQPMGNFRVSCKMKGGGGQWGVGGLKIRSVAYFLFLLAKLIPKELGYGPGYYLWGEERSSSEDVRKVLCH